LAVQAAAIYCECDSTVDCSQGRNEYEG
jgi:hypothetical protein